MRLLLGICPFLLVTAAVTSCSQPPPTPVYLSLDGVGSADETIRYYEAMKDHPPEPTLAEWKKSRCFPDENDAKDQLKAFYYNPSDLGLGREMRCAQCPPDPKTGKKGLISCAVSNHGPKDGPTLGIATVARLKALGAPDVVVSDEQRKEIRKGIIRESLIILDNFLSQDSGVSGAAKKIFRLQTVAMDYDPNRPDANERVRFYIYDAENPKALIAPNTIPTGLIPGLALDNEGVKFMRNCTYCHGGVFDPGRNKILGSSFLDFNLAFLNFADTPALLEKNESFIAAATQTQFLPDNKGRLEALNGLVKATQPAPMILDRIDNSKYVVTQTKLGVQIDQAYVPAGWNDTPEHADLFKTVVLPYCATCHFSQSLTFNLRLLDANADLLTFSTATEWLKPSNILDTQKRVCASGDMPHAEVTRLNLLADPVAFGKICAPVP